MCAALSSPGRPYLGFSFAGSSSSPSPRPPPPRHLTLALAIETPESSTLQYPPTITYYETPESSTLQYPPPIMRPPSLRRRPRRTRCPQRRTRSHILPSSQEHSSPLSSSMCESSYVFSPSSASSSSSSSEANSSPHLIPSTKPLPARDKKLKDGAPCIGGIHTSAAVSTGSVILLPLTAPGHNCAVITRPLVPQWTHIRRPPIGQLSHLMKEAIGRNQTQSDTIRRNHTQSSAVVPVHRGALAPAHSRRLASDPGTASPSHAQTWRTLGTRLGSRMRVVRKPTPVAGAARPSYPRGAEA